MKNGFGGAVIQLVFRSGHVRTLQRGGSSTTWAAKDVALLADRISTTTTPAMTSTVTTNHVEMYVLTVNGGTGSGRHPVGKVISVEQIRLPLERF